MRTSEDDFSHLGEEASSSEAGGTEGGGDGEGAADEREQRALVAVGMKRVQRVRDHRLQDGVPEKLHPLIVRGGIGFFSGSGWVGQGKAQQGLIAKCVTERLL